MRWPNASHHFAWFLLAAGCLWLPGQASADILRVKAGAPNPPTGTSWDSALATITDALALAQPGDEVWVAAGTYLERITLPAGVGLYGGFSATETQRGQRPPAGSDTTIGAQYGGRAVTVAAGAGPDTVLDRFTVSTGFSGLNTYGGAILCEGASPTITNNTFLNNGGLPHGGGFGIEYYDYVNAGGGVALFNSHAIVTGNTFRGNMALESGALYVEGGSPQIVGNTFISNRGGLQLKGTDTLVSGNTFSGNAGLHGSGLICDGGAPTVTGNTFSGNSTTDDYDPEYSHRGSAILCRNATSADIRGNTFSDNGAQSGGVVHCMGAAPTIRGNTFTGHDINASGPVVIGIIMCEAGAAGRIVDNLFTGNSVRGGSSSPTGPFGQVGILVFADGCSPVVANNTLFRNNGGYQAGVVNLTAGADPLLANNLVAYNGSGLYASPDRTSAIRAQSNCFYANKAGNYVGTPDLTGVSGNITADPLFTNAGHWNLHLQPGSPCVNAGADSVVAEGDQDMDGLPRRSGAAVDIGADEFDGTIYPDPPRTYYVRENGDDANDGTSWATARRTIQAALAAAKGGDSVWVAAGTYPGVTLAQGISVYGGFRGDETALEMRDWKANRSTIQGSSGQTSVWVGGGTWAGTVLDGFTIRNAQSTTTYGGAGVNVGSAEDVVIRNNTIIGNGSVPGSSFEPLAGGIYAGANTIIEHNVIRGNVGFSGGGVNVFGSAVVRNNIITGNNATLGAGVYISGSGVTVSDNVIAGNVASSGQGPSPSGRGGGIAVYQASPRIYNNTIVANEAKTAGGISLTEASPTFANNIVAFNSHGFAGTPAATSAPVFLANDVFENATNWAGIADPTGTGGNISADPMLAQLSAGNFHIQPGSPCLDTGDATLLTAGETDIDGQPRRQGGGVDIGADESDGAPWPALPPAVVRVSAMGDDANDGSSWATAFRSIRSAADSLPFGGEVWVAAGEYSGPVEVGPCTKLYGGFAGAETDPSTRAPASHPTVVTTASISPAITLRSVQSAVDGFTISGGTIGVNAYTGAAVTGNMVSGVGVTGIWVGGPNALISGNTVTDSVSGVQVDNMTGVIAGNTLLRNTGTPTPTRYTVGGNGLYVAGGDVLVRDNRIEDNATGLSQTAYSTPAGVVVKGARVTMERNTIRHNGSGEGAGITILPLSGQPAVQSIVTLAGNVITDNHGGGVSCAGTALLHDNAIARNIRVSANGVVSGVGVTVNDGPVTMVNNSIVAHATNISVLYSPSVDLVNNVVAFGDVGLSRRSGTTIPVTLRYNAFYNTQNYKNLPDATGTGGNIATDPRLAGPTHNDIHLAPDSPLRDAGDNSAVLPGSLDTDGQARAADGHVDIGADECDGSLPPVYTVHVKPDGLDTQDGLTWDTAVKTMTAGLRAAGPGEEVWVAAGTYADQVVLRDRVRLLGGFAGTETSAAQRDPAAHATILDGGNARTVVTAGAGITPATVLDGFVIQNGYSPTNAGGIQLTGGSPTITNNTIANNVSTGSMSAGALSGTAASSVVRGNRIVDNTGYRAGGVSFADGSPVITDNLFSGNKGPQGNGGALQLTRSTAQVTGNTFELNIGAKGGALYLTQANVVLEGNAIRQNTGGYGAGVYIDQGTVTLRNNTIQANAGTSPGGGLYSTGATLTLTGNTFTGNSATQGGGLFVTGGSAVASGNTVSENQASTAWGGICVQTATLTLEGNTIDTNTPGAVGVQSAPVLVMRDNLVRGNLSAAGSQGTISINGSTISLVGNTISGNSAASYAGATVTASTLGLIQRNDIRNNVAALSSAGLTCSGEMRVEGNTIIGNTARYHTGLLVNAGRAYVRNNVIAGNVASGGTPGIYWQASSGEIVGNTIANNIGTGPGIQPAVYASPAPLLANNIIAGNGGGVSGTFALSRVHHNCVFANNGYNWQDTSLEAGVGNLAADPLFADAPDGDYHLLAGSPCIDAGDDSLIQPDDTDANGRSRVQGRHVDLGALEYPGAAGYRWWDAVAALKVAGGLAVSSGDSSDRLAAADSVPGTVALTDAAAIARKAAGLD